MEGKKKFIIYDIYIYIYIRYCYMILVYIPLSPTALTKDVVSSGDYIFKKINHGQQSIEQPYVREHIPFTPVLSGST